MSSLSDGAVRVEKGAFVEIIDVLFSSNVADNGGCVHADGLGTKVVLKQVESTGSQVNEFGGFVCAENGSEVEIYDAKIAKASTKKKGGVIAILSGSTVTAFDLRATESSAEEAGAVIHAQGFGSVGFLSNSTVVDASSNYGGVFSAENGGKITMKHSTTNQINARKNGGLMYANGKNSKITLQYCQGMALIAKHSGGLLHAENQSSILIEDSTFMNLLANKGGTVSLSDQGTMASIKRSTIQQTTAHSLGGGLHLNKQAILHLKNTKWKNLEVQGEQGGAGMYLENGAQVQGGSISESNIFTQLKAHVGAGIVSNGKNVVATGLSFNQLHAERGAGIYVLQNHVEKVENVEATNLKLSNIDIFKANATLSGAGIYSFHSNSIVEINDIQFNQIWSKKGGVAHIFNSSLSILNLRVEHSQVETIGGLALLEESATLLVDGGSMNNISSLQNGGGLYITDESTATIKNMHANSISTDSKGGFALVRKQSQLHLSSTTIHDCFARKSGGTIHAQEASIITMLKTLTTKSYSDGVGGTVALYESSRLLGDGATIFRNTTAAEKGGGIYLDGTNVTVQGIEIDGASSLLGAGLYADGTKTKLQNMKIKNCKATNGGGGLYATAGAQLNILETYIDTSRSTIGGGLYVTENSIVHGERVFLRNNTADRGGGSMVDKKSTIYLTASIIYGNFAKEGAGICLTEGGVGDFKENTQFIRNKASKQGGGLMVVTESSARLQNSEMYENSGFYGGAIYVDGCDIYLITVKINYNTVANGGYGGGLFIAKNGNAQVLKGTVFEGNSATKGGAGYIEYGSLFYLDNSKLHANKAVYDGGGLFVNDALALLYKSTISNNEAVDEGGGVNVQNGGNLTATETKFFGNNVGGQEETGSGIGSVAVLGRSTSVQILECDFYDNKALNIGGLYATEAKVHIEASRFYDNEAKEGAGLVLDRTSNGMSYISNSKFYRNKAREDGGGAVIRGEVKAKIENCEFGPDNEAGSVGGGLLIDKLAKVWMKDVKIYRNRAVSGAGIRISGKGQLVMRGKCEINNNVAVEGAGISAVDKSWLNIQDASFKQNNASMRGGGIMMTHTNCPKETKQIGKLVATATLYVPCIQIDTTHFEENIAGAGGGFFWRYREPTVKKGCMFVGVSGIVILPGNQLYDAADALDQRIMDTMDCIDDKFCNLVSDLKEDCSSSESRDFKCNNCNYGPELLNQPTGAGTNAMGTRVIYFPDQGVETGLQLFGDGVTIQIEVTDRYGLRSTLDDTTKCSISKDPLEVGDLGIDEGVAQSKRGVVSFNRNGGVRFLGDGDITYKIVMDCLIDGVIDMSYDTTVTVQWCEPGYAPIARICRPCQDRMYSLYGKWCLDCPTGGNCTALHRSSDGLPRGVGEPRALPGFWLYTAPVKAMLNRCPSDWLDGQEHCNPSELLQIETGICIDREWPSFQLHMCLTQIIFYRCPRGPASCPGNFSMSQVLLGDNYTSGEFDPQCNVGYSNVICGNCLLGYYPAVADECTKCLNSEGEEVQTKMFYGGLMMFMVLLLGVFIFYYLMDGILVGKKWAPHTGPMSCCQKCRKGCRHKVTEGMSQGFQIEKFKIALGLFQVFSSFKMTYEIDWPPEVIEWFNQFAIFENLDILKLVAMDCLFKTDYLFSLKFQTLSPLFLVFIVWCLWEHSHKIYAKKLALYPRVCSECHHPIDPFEDTRRQRAIDHWITKHNYCFQMKWKTNVWIRKKFGCRPVTVKDQWLHKKGMNQVEPCNYDNMKKKKNETKKLIKKQKKALKIKNKMNKTAVVPIKFVEEGKEKIVLVIESQIDLENMDISAVKNALLQIQGVESVVHDQQKGTKEFIIWCSDYIADAVFVKIIDDETGFDASVVSGKRKINFDALKKVKMKQQEKEALDKKKNNKAHQKRMKNKKKKKLKTHLKRKNSLENNFSDNSTVHKYGCPTNTNSFHGLLGHTDPYYQPKHREERIFNFKMRVKLRMKFRNFKSRCLKLLFWILLIVYPSVSRKILMLYKCIDIGTSSYMMWDTQVQCYTTAWYLHSIYALVFGCIYILGVPGMFFGLLRQSRHWDVDRQWDVIKSSPSRLVKTLKLAREDYWSKGMHWSKIISAKEEMRRVKWYLCNINMRAPKTQMRIGFLYRPFQEDYWAFELLEFLFKLMMTGVMVHIRPGTVTQIIAGLAMCFVAFAIHLGYQPYIDDSNNVLMAAGKMQLFLTLMLALLLKMEAAFFTGNAQMDEADVGSLSVIIIGSSGALVLLWISSVFKDCYMHRAIRKKEKRREDEARMRRKRFKKTTNLLKAATLKGKMFSNMGKVMPKNNDKLHRKNQKLMEKQQKQFEMDKQAMLKKKQMVNLFGANVGGATDKTDIQKWAEENGGGNHFKGRMLQKQNQQRANQNQSLKTWSTPPKKTANKNSLLYNAMHSKKDDATNSTLLSWSSEKNTEEEMVQEMDQKMDQELVQKKTEEKTEEKTEGIADGAGNNIEIDPQDHLDLLASSSDDDIDGGEHLHLLASSSEDEDEPSYVHDDSSAGDKLSDDQVEPVQKHFGILNRTATRVDL